MSDTQARKEGIHFCRPYTPGSTVCVAAYGPVDGLERFDLVFDNRSKRIRDIFYKQVIQTGGKFNKDSKPWVKVQECASGLHDRNECFILPDKVLSQEFKVYDRDQRTEIWATVNAAKVSAFLKSKRKSDQAGREAMRIQSGK
ncbi:hypothetical protein ABIC63_005969 [Pseudacidovorax sp. 1753]|uniref:hypothetical protein n=1 Tax=Pseudacidovorax sp. 1753 TaxID=3156419 RepID=UPI003391B368